MQFEVEIHTGEFVPFYSKDAELLITLCGADKNSEELSLETENDEPPELASNAVRSPVVAFQIFEIDRRVSSVRHKGHAHPMRFVF